MAEHVCMSRDARLRSADQQDNNLAGGELRVYMHQSPTLVRMRNAKARVWTKDL